MNMIMDNIPPETQIKKHRPTTLFANNDIVLEILSNQIHTANTKEVKHHEYMA